MSPNSVETRGISPRVVNRRIDHVFSLMLPMQGVDFQIDLRPNKDGKLVPHYKASADVVALAGQWHDFIFGNGVVKEDFFNKAGADDKKTVELLEKVAHLRKLRKTAYYEKKRASYHGDGEYIDPAELDVLKTARDVIQQAHGYAPQVDRDAETEKYPTVNEAASLPPIVAEHDGNTEKYEAVPMQLGVPELDQHIRNRAVAIAQDPAKQSTERIRITQEIPHVGRQRVIPEVAHIMVRDVIQKLGLNEVTNPENLPDDPRERATFLQQKYDEQSFMVNDLLRQISLEEERHEQELMRLRGEKGVALVELENAQQDLRAVRVELEQLRAQRQEMVVEQEIEEAADETEEKRQVPFAHALFRLVTAGTILIGVIAPVFAQKHARSEAEDNRGVSPSITGLSHNADLDHLPMEPKVFEKILQEAGFNKSAADALVAYAAPIARGVKKDDGFRYSSVAKFVAHLWPSVTLTGDFSYEAAASLDQYLQYYVKLPLTTEQIRANKALLPAGALLYANKDENSDFNKIGDHGEAAGYIGIVVWDADGSEHLVDEIERPIDQVFDEMNSDMSVYVPLKNPELHEAVKVYLASMRGKTLQEGLPGLIDTCKSVYPDNMVMAQLLCAQAILESGWANLSPDDPRRELADVDNNPLGIKGTGTAGSVPVNTTEDYGNGQVPVTDMFAKFATLQDAFDKHRSLMEWDNYAPVWKQKTFEDAARCIANSACVQDPYATAKDYGDALISISNQFLKGKFEATMQVASEAKPEQVVLPQNVVLGEKPQYYLNSETEYIAAIKKEFGINIDPDYDLQHVEWIWEALWSVNNTDYVKYIKGMNVVKRPTTPSEEDGCAFDPVSLSLYPYPTKDLFIAAFFHESGHFVDHCPVDGQPGVYITRSDGNDYMAVVQADGAVSYYGKKNRQEDFADMVRLALYKVNAQMVNDPRFPGNIIPSSFYDEDVRFNGDWEHWVYVVKLLGLKGK